MGRSKEKENKLVSAAPADDDHEQEASTEVEFGIGKNAGPSPEIKASLLSKMMFFWVTPLFTKARRVRRKENRELEMEDFWDLPKIDKTEQLFNKFEAFLDLQRRKHKTDSLTAKQTEAALTSGLWSIVRRDMWLAGWYKAINVLALFSYLFLLNNIISSVQILVLFPDDEEVFFRGIIFVCIFGAVTFLNAVVENRYVILFSRAGWQIRSILTTTVYRKTLKMSAASRQSMTAGEIVNLMQIDAEGISRVSAIYHELWSSPIQLVGYLAILYTYIDWATFTGMIVLVVTFPIVLFIFSRLVVYQKAFAALADERVLQVNEVLQSMQGVKMGGWENKFASVIGKVRNKELSKLKVFGCIIAVALSFMLAIPTFAAIVSLSSFALAELGRNDAATLFTALGAFALLRQPVMVLPQMLNILSEGLIRRRRVGAFLSLKEVIPFKEQKEEEQATGADNTAAVSIVDGQFFWADPAMASEGIKETKKKMKTSKENSKVPQEDDLEAQRRIRAYTIPALDNIDIQIKKGSLVGVCGPVASGKSSLCAAIINEMHKARGQVRVNGTVAYAAQTAWIFHATVRENILFGTPFDETRYQAVLQACQLARDLELLDNGDQTEVGEQGINLSGGQKARISLARAAYSASSIVILDDPLSALDPGVANKVFEQCILGLLKGRTRILVTNQLNLLPKCDTIIALTSGQILEQGRYSVLKRSGLEFSKILRDYHGGEEQDEETKTSANTGQDKVAVVNQGGKGDDLMEKEERNIGAVSFGSYFHYVKAGGGFCAAIPVVITCCFMEGANLGSQVWVSIWSDDPDSENYSLYVYLGVYGVSGFVVMLGTFLCVVTIMLFGIRASRKLHKDLLASVLHAPMSFFDSTPTGRIVGRFSKDINFIDRLLPNVVNGLMFSLLAIIVAIGTIAYATYLFLLLLPILLPIYIALLQYYRPTMRDVKRIESITRSPIYSHFSESITGLTTIRAYDNSDLFGKNNTGKVDKNIQAWYLLKSVEVWLFLRIGCISSIITIGAGVFAIFAARSGAISPGLVGLSLTYAVQVTDMLGGMVRVVSEVEASFNAVERIQHYSLNLPQEKPFESKKPPPKSWPKDGKIEITDLHMRYKPSLPMVLKGLTLTIDGGERVGIVGRTGCGKSSLMLALMRLVEPEHAEDGSGPVIIDGIDVSKIGLHELRSKIGIVPQNPMLFSGTIRSNMDPFDSYEDDKMWAALEACTLKDAIIELGGLDSKVSEFGENMSQGQRQLLVLSRALLNDTRILLLDEATSSLDHATDAAIQTSLRKNFANSTCITIAHRLETVADSDKILVLDSGNILEFDAPAVLLKDRGSTFSKMVSELGPSMAAKLRRTARTSLSRSTDDSSQDDAAA